jgi:hypothetical protein
MQRPAKPRTLVRIRPEPPSFHIKGYNGYFDLDEVVPLTGTH